MYLAPSWRGQRERRALAEEPAEARRARGQGLVDLAREDLDLFAADELAERIAALEAEIARVRARMAARQSTRAAADALFARRD